MLPWFLLSNKNGQLLGGILFQTFAIVLKRTNQNVKMPWTFSNYFQKKFSIFPKTHFCMPKPKSWKKQWPMTLDKYLSYANMSFNSLLRILQLSNQVLSDHVLKPYKPSCPGFPLVMFLRQISLKLFLTISFNQPHLGLKPSNVSQKLLHLTLKIWNPMNKGR